MPTFSTPNPVAATVEVAGAEVLVTAGDRTDTVVRIEPIGTTSRAVTVAEKAKVEFTDGRLAVTTPKAGDKAGSVAITIDLPTGSSLAAQLAHSDVRVDGRVGRCELQMASGRVQLDQVDALRADIASGEVVIDRIAGRADIDGATFAIRIGEVAGAVGLSTSGGQAWIGHAHDELDLGGAGGDVTVDRADGDVVATTAGGAIRIGRLTNGRARLTTGSGDIEVGIGDGIAASLDVDSERGTVHNFVVSQVEPRESEARVSVHARTRHGDITLNRVAG